MASPKTLRTIVNIYGTSYKDSSHHDSTKGGSCSNRNGSTKSAKRSRSGIRRSCERRTAEEGERVTIKISIVLSTMACKDSILRAVQAPRPNP